MEPGPSGSGTSGGGGDGVVSGGGMAAMSEGTVQQMIMNPIPGPSTRPYLATPIPVPAQFLVPEQQLLPHQVRSGIDIRNLFKLLNALQNRIALACGQHQYLKDPLRHPRPPEDGGYKPLTPKAAVRDIRTLCRQQKTLMEKLRRWNCMNEGSCYELIMKYEFDDICINCQPFAASHLRHRKVDKALKKEQARAKRRALKKKNAIAASKLKPKLSVVQKSSPLSQPQPVQQPLRKRRKKSLGTCEPPHPESFLSQENFLSQLGLVTPEVYQKTQAESRRTERRRRTTANPKYKSGVFVNPNVVGRSKRSRRSDPESLPEPSVSNAQPSRPGADRRKARQRRYECTVCEKKDVNVECTKCLSGFHADCIRVSASKAPAPSTVSVCPNCVDCNPDISASDCILLSRRMCRPSIMSLKTEPAQQSRLKPTTSTSRSIQKATPCKRKAGAKTVSKPTAQRKSPSPVKAKTKTSFKQPVQPKPKKTQTGKKSSTSKRIPNSLNHSLAVAAAAAVPAYCTSLRSSVEVAPVQEKVKTVQSPPPPPPTPPPPPPTKQKVIPPVGIKWNKKHSKLRVGNDGRQQFPRRDISSLPPPVSTDRVEMVGVKKVVNVKAAQLFPPHDPISTTDAGKQTPRLQLNHVGSENSKQKNQSLLPTQSNITQAVKKQTESKCKPKAVPVPVVSNEENDRPPISTDVKKSTSAASPSKGASKKKANGLKPVDPFCMKRTMMAMCAAAGIVMSTNGIKIPGLSQTPQPSLPTTSSQTQSTSPSPTSPGDGKEPTPSTSSTPTPKPIKSNVTPPEKIPLSSVKPKEQEVKGAIKAAGNAIPSKAPLSTSASNVAAATIKKSPVRRKKPVVELDPAVERNVLDTISRVIRESSSGTYNKEEDNVTCSLVATIKTSSPTTSKPEPTKPASIQGPKEASASSTKEVIKMDTSSKDDTMNDDVDDDDLDKPPVLKEYTKESPTDVNRSYSYGTYYSSNEVNRSASPSSNSSTIGSSRSLSDIVSDDSSDELLSIPDTSYPPYLELKMLDEPNPLLNFGTLDRMELLNRKVTPPSISPGSAKRGRPSGRGRASK